MKALLHKLLSWCPLYRMAIGGYWYYNYIQDGLYRPRDFLYFGKGARIGGNVGIMSTKRMYVGDHAYIAGGCRIIAHGGFHLGNYSGLGAHTTVFTVEHRHAGAKEIPFDDVRLIKPVYIEDYVFVGTNVSILPGVRIGKGAIIGLASVVTRDVPPLSIVMGNPAKIIGHRNKEHFERLVAGRCLRSPGKQSTTMWTPPLTLRKYRDELREFGFDTSNGRTFFGYTPS